jgi:hypothetical protein
MDVARVKSTVLRNEATDVLSVNQTSYDNKYTLNAEKCSMINYTPLILELDIMQWIRGMSLSKKSRVFFPFINRLHLVKYALII